MAQTPSRRGAFVGREPYPVVAERQDKPARLVRIGTVNTATSPLLVPAVRDFQQAHPGTTVEVLTLQQQSYVAALRQYLRLLAGQSALEGVDLEASETPLVQ